MTLFAMGQATKTGIEVRGDDKSKVKCKSRKVGNMNMPDPQDLEENFFSNLTAVDVVVSPSGANYTLLVGAYVRTSHVYWIDPGTLAEKMENGLKGKSTCVALLELFQKEPDLFYEYKPTNAKLAQLLMAVRNWLNLEQQCTADGNAYAQYLRRERDLTIFQKPERKAWVAREVEREVKKVGARVRATGVKLTKAQMKSMRSGLAKEYLKRYDSYFGASAKDAVAVQKKLIEDRMAWFGVDELEADAETRVRDLLNEMPESKLFDGLLGEGAIKTRGEVLAFVRNPLFYDVFAQLEHYAGIGKLDGGQAQRRVHGVRLVGRPEFRKALCFDFGEKYWQCDTIGYFKAMYYAYKRHQVLRYWPLIQITSDVWKLFGKVSSDDEEADELDVDDAVEEELVAKPEEADSIRDIARRLEAISHLPVIGRNPDVQRAIASLQKEPDKKLLWKLFSKGSGGYNLQMPPKRIERQTKRMLGSVLLQTVYYRWLKMLEEPLPLAQDYKYVAQYRHVTGDAKAVPTEFDHELVLKYFVKIGDELEQAANLPVEAAIKLIMPDKRADYLNKLPLDARVSALCALTDKDCATFAMNLENADRAKLFSLFPSARRDKVREVMAELQAKAKEAAEKSTARQTKAADKAEATATKKRAKSNGGQPVELTGTPVADAE